MFGISFFELLIVFAITLIFLGPDKLPDAARQLGRLMATLKRNSDALRREFYNTVYAPSDEVKRQIDLAKRELVAMDFMSDDPATMNCEQRARASVKSSEEANAPEEPDAKPDNKNDDERADS